MLECDVRSSAIPHCRRGLRARAVRALRERQLGAEIREMVAAAGTEASRPDASLPSREVTWDHRKLGCY